MGDHSRFQSTRIFVLFSSILSMRWQMLAGHVIGTDLMYAIALF